MNGRLVEEGWVAPADPGPTRRHALALLGVGALLLLAWGTLGTGWLSAQIAPDRRDVVVAVAPDGEVSIDGRAVETQLLERADVAFLVAEAGIPGPGGDPVHVRVRPGDGVDPEAVVVRRLLPLGRAEDGRLLVTVATSGLPVAPSGIPDDVASLSSLRARTDPFDARVREVRDDRLLRDRLRDDWFWIAPLALLVAVGGPLLAWRRQRRRTFSQRVPGPGREVDLAPPSSLDPVGAAILVAGARRPDPAAAFAGHVLDLVERRQLPMRRSASTPPGLGTLLGMHHAEELDDLAVSLLAELVPEGDTSLFLADSGRAASTLSAGARERWRAHLDARAGFERLVERAPVRRLQLATVLLAATSLAALVVALVASLQGRTALALLVAATAAAAAVTVGAWLLDARRWRTVARARRTERAQWIAWRAARSADPATTIDDRALPVLVATGDDLPGVRAATSADAVDLAAVTTRTVAALRTLVDPLA